MRRLGFFIPLPVFQSSLPKISITRKENASARVHQELPSSARLVIPPLSRRFIPFQMMIVNPQAHRGFGPIPGANDWKITVWRKCLDDLGDEELDLRKQLWRNSDQPRLSI
ncbi:hypothetical protein L1887_32152 [Cichorium endivia]|nr:hypothetical protein L1887_32152 [Cichorium endivia]